MAYFDWLLSLSHGPIIFFTTHNLPHKTVVTKFTWKCVVLAFFGFKTMRSKSEKVKVNVKERDEQVEGVCLEGNGFMVLLDLLG